MWIRRRMSEVTPILSLAILMIGLLSFASPVLASDPSRFIFPKPKVVTALRGVVRLDHRTRVEIQNATEDDQFAVEMLKAELLPTTINVVGRDETLIRLNHIAKWDQNDDLGVDGYVLEVSPETGLALTATTSRGLYYAAQTLLQIAEKKSGVWEIPAIRIIDWPDAHNRIASYDLRYSSMNTDVVERWIRSLSRMKINQFVLLNRSESISNKDSKESFEGQIRNLKDYAHRHQIELIEREDVFDEPPSLCVGGERFLYEMSSFGQSLWSSSEIDDEEFHRRFAAFWFGARDGAAASHVEQAFMFFSRTAGDDWKNVSKGFMNASYRDLVRGISDDELRTRMEKASKIHSSIPRAERALNALTKRSSVNRMADDSFAGVYAGVDHVGQKVSTMSEVSLAYRRAYERSSRSQALVALDRAIRKLRVIDGSYPSLQEHLRSELEKQGVDPRELDPLEDARCSCAQMIDELENAKFAIAAHRDLPTPEDLDLR